MNVFLLNQGTEILKCHHISKLQKTSTYKLKILLQMLLKLMGHV